MKTELAYYNISPKMVPVGKTSRICIAPKGGHAAFQEGAEYTLRVIPMHRAAPLPSLAGERSYRPDMLQSAPRQIFGSIPPPDYPTYRVLPVGGALFLEHCFAAEQQYMLVMEGPDRPPLRLRVYALQEDLFALRPYKACLHSHSLCSDGVEDPQTVAACYRRAGYDIFALTDHGQFSPSLQCIEGFSGLPLDMLLLTGEEVHAPGSNIHILNIGAESSVNTLCHEDVDSYLAQVEQIQAELDIDDERDRFEYASATWCFQQIARAKGLSILAHPNWIWQDTYNIPPALTFRFLEQAHFDALEVVNGGDTPQENEEQVAIWQQARTQGCRIPVVAADDSHGVINGQWFDIAYTYVLARDNRREEVIKAIQEGHCGGVLQYPGESARFYGEYRLVSYLSFLHQEYFPLHDELCAEEGRLMQAWLAQEESAAQRLAQCQGQTRQLLERCFAAQGDPGHET